MDLRNEFLELLASRKGQLLAAGVLLRNQVPDADGKIEAASAQCESKSRGADVLVWEHGAYHLDLYENSVPGGPSRILTENGYVKNRDDLTYLVDRVAAYTVSQHTSAPLDSGLQAKPKHVSAVLASQMESVCAHWNACDIASEAVSPDPTVETARWRFAAGSRHVDISIALQGLLDVTGSDANRPHEPGTSFVFTGEVHGHDELAKLLNSVEHFLRGGLFSFGMEESSKH